MKILRPIIALLLCSALMADAGFAGGLPTSLSRPPAPTLQAPRFQQEALASGAVWGFLQSLHRSVRWRQFRMAPDSVPPASRLGGIPPIGWILGASVATAIWFSSMQVGLVFRDLHYHYPTLFLVRDILSTLGALVLSIYTGKVAFLYLWLSLVPGYRAILHGEKPVRITNFANRPLTISAEPGPFTIALKPDEWLSFTIHPPIYMEAFGDTIQPMLDDSRAACDAYNRSAARAGSPARANIVVSDDGLMILADDDIAGTEREARARFAQAKSEGRLAAQAGYREAVEQGIVTEAQGEVLTRLDYYERYNLTVVARPRPNPARPETIRRGSFKKPSNLNYALRPLLDIDRLVAGGLTREEAAVRVRVERPELALGWTRGGEPIHSLIVAVDKDSGLPASLMMATMPEFVADPKLAIAQHRTFAANPHAGFFAASMATFLHLMSVVGMGGYALVGGHGLFIGHNAVYRRGALEEIGYWDEKSAAEDFHFMMQATARGWHTKILAFPGLDTTEVVSRAHHEEAGRQGRIAFATLAIMINPLRQWREKGILREDFRRYLFSPHISWWTRLDLIVQISVFPMHATSIPVAIGTALYRGWLDSYIIGFLPVVVIFNVFSTIVALRLGVLRLPRSVWRGFKTLARFQAYGFSLGLTTMALAGPITRGLASYLFSRRPNFGATNVDDLSRLSLRQILRDTKAAWQESAAFVGVMILLIGINQLGGPYYSLFSLPFFMITVGALLPIVTHRYLLAAAMRAAFDPIRRARHRWRAAHTPAGMPAFLDLIALQKQPLERPGRIDLERLEGNYTAQIARVRREAPETSQLLTALMGLLAALDTFNTLPAARRRDVIELARHLGERRLARVFERLDESFSYEAAVSAGLDWLLNLRPAWTDEIMTLTPGTVTAAFQGLGSRSPALINVDVLIYSELARRRRPAGSSGMIPFLYDGQIPEMDVEPGALRQVTCPLDGEPFDETVGRLRVNDVELRVARHSADGMMALSPQPSGRYFDTMYSGFYFKQNGESTEQVGIRAYSAKEAERRTRLAEVQINEWQRLEGVRPPDRVMEVGPGGGYLMEAAARRGFTVTGVDLSEFAVSQLRARGLDVEQGTLETYLARHPEAAGSFDLIALYDLLEHVTDPNGFLKSVRALLKPSGVIVIRTPNNAGHPPTLHLLDHLWHFTGETLAALLRKNGLWLADGKPSGIFNAGSERTLENMTVFALRDDAAHLPAAAGVRWGVRVWDRALHWLPSFSWRQAFGSVALAAIVLITGANYAVSYPQANPQSIKAFESHNWDLEISAEPAIVRPADRTWQESLERTLKLLQDPHLSPRDAQAWLHRLQSIIRSKGFGAGEHLNRADLQHLVSFIESPAVVATPSFAAREQAFFIKKTALYMLGQRFWAASPQSPDRAWILNELVHLLSHQETTGAADPVFQRYFPFSEGELLGQFVRQEAYAILYDWSALSSEGGRFTHDELARRGIDLTARRDGKDLVSAYTAVIAPDAGRGTFDYFVRTQEMLAQAKAEKGHTVPVSVADAARQLREVPTGFIALLRQKARAAGIPEDVLIASWLERQRQGVPDQLGKSHLPAAWQDTRSLITREAGAVGAFRIPNEIVRAAPGASAAVMLLSESRNTDAWIGLMQRAIRETEALRQAQATASVHHPYRRSILDLWGKDHVSVADYSVIPSLEKLNATGESWRLAGLHPQWGDIMQVPAAYRLLVRTSGILDDHPVNPAKSDARPKQTPNTLLRAG